MALLRAERGAIRVIFRIPPYSGEPLCRAGITHVIQHQGEADGPSGEGSELLENGSMEEMLPNGTPSGGHCTIV